MIYHVLTAGCAFLQPAIACFSAAQVDSTYFVIGLEAEDRRLPSDSKVTYLQLASSDYLQFLKSLGHFQGLVVFHGLLDTNLKVASDILKVKNPFFKMGWIIYGAEIQHSLLSIDRFHGAITKATYYRLKPVRLLLPLLKWLPGSDRRLTRAVIRGMDHWIHFLPEELQWVEKELGVSRPRLWFTYVMIQDFIGSELFPLYVSDSKNILIGNSSSFASNHLEVIHRLAGRLEGDCRVIVPLSYGNKQYGAYVTQQGKKLLGSQFQPLVELIPRAQYNEILLSCPVVVMNHYRQQGLGNILTALWMGARVHLNEGVSTYAFLKREGVHVFTMEDFYANEVNGLLQVSRLPQTLADENRALLSGIFGKENVARQIRNSFLPFSA